MPEDDAAPVGEIFAFFNEVGIIAQLSRALFESRLPDGITVQHFSVLNHLIRVADGRTPLELANAFQVPKTSMTHTLAGLEKRGFVEVGPNPEDGRSKLIWLTPSGRAFRQEAQGLLSEDINRLSEKITADRIAPLLPELTQIRQILDKDRDPKKPSRREQPAHLR
ncbi:MAG: MarR family transcriptional regulator [Pseudomonadota bacterium]